MTSRAARGGEIFNDAAALWLRDNDPKLRRKLKRKRKLESNPELRRHIRRKRQRRKA